MTSSTEIKIHVTQRDGSRHVLQSQPTQVTLMQVLYDEDQGIEAVCGGCVSCATCHVLIDEEWIPHLPERDEIEGMLLEYQEHFDVRRSRLSCQVALSPELDGLAVVIAPEE